MTTFKEELTIEADNNAYNIGISTEIQAIKTKMKEAVDYRNFTITLVKVNPGETMAIGGYCPKGIYIFVPELISPLHYRQIFINELIKLGFAEEDIILSVKEYDICDYYNIKLVW